MKMDNKLEVLESLSTSLISTLLVVIMFGAHVFFEMPYKTVSKVIVGILLILALTNLVIVRMEINLYKSDLTNSGKADTKELKCHR